MSISVFTPFPVITDIDGQPLDDGYIWVGQNGLDPVANPQNAYWDVALTQLATQPVRTRGGYALNGTTRARLFTANVYSIRVDNQNGSTVYQSLSENGRFGGDVTASEVATAGGATVQQGIFDRGNPTAIIGSKAEVDWERDDTGSTYPPEDLGGLWPSAQVYYRNAINAEFDATNAPVAAPLSSPASTVMISSHNKGSDAIVIPLQTIAGVHANGKEAANLNCITYSEAGTTNVKLKGVEIDLQPAATSTISEAFGLAINCFTKAIPGPAIYIESIFGGEWGTGILIGNLSNIGSGLSPAGGNPSMGTLVDTGTAQYQIEAIKLSNTHKVRFEGTASAHARVFMDSGNFWKFVLGSGSLVWRDNSDTSTLMSLSTTGDLALEAGGTIRFTSALVTTSATAGTATALPATPQGYLTVNVAGVNRKIPFYV